jgi:hypothetical protein
MCGNRKVLSCIIRYTFLKTIICYFDVTSASARISKGQGYRVFLRKRAGSSFGQKRAICVIKEKLEKWTEFHSF